MAIRCCPTCRHRTPLLAGRCTERFGDTICGCVCPPERRHVLDARRSSSEDAMDRALRAVAEGQPWGVGVSAATGLHASRAYAALRVLTAEGLIEREPGRGPKRDQYRLTDRGRQALSLQQENP